MKERDLVGDAPFFKFGAVLVYGAFPNAKKIGYLVGSRCSAYRWKAQDRIQRICCKLPDDFVCGRNTA